MFIILIKDEVVKEQSDSGSSDKMELELYYYRRN